MSCFQFLHVFVSSSLFVSFSSCFQFLHAFILLCFYVAHHVSFASFVYCSCLLWFCVLYFLRFCIVVPIVSLTEKSCSNLFPFLCLRKHVVAVSLLRMSYFQFVDVLVFQIYFSWNGMESHGGHES